MISVCVSLLCGAMIGFEREYRNKAAGLRTIMLISLGATIFTLVSWHFRSGTNDRVASNIVTGIGFIGAGVIFKEKIWVRGLTTAAVIWISAAIGIMAGTHYYFFALLLAVITVTVLSVFHLLEKAIDDYSHKREFIIQFKDLEVRHLDFIQNEMKKHHLRSEKKLVYRTESQLIVVLDVRGKRKLINHMNELMLVMPGVASFEVM
nr:MgtC/SapB family protein [Hufsiella arboris]